MEYIPIFWCIGGMQGLKVLIYRDNFVWVNLHMGNLGYMETFNSTSIMHPGGIEMCEELCVKDWIQIAQWTTAIIGVITTSTLGVIAAFRSVRTKKLELRWNKSNLARQLIEKIENDRAVASVFDMIDLNRTEVDLGNGIELVTREQIIKAFKAGRGPFSGNDTPIRLVFDKLFVWFEHLENDINLELIEFNVAYFFRYHVENLLKIPNIFDYLKEFKFEMAANFISRFPGQSHA